MATSESLIWVSQGSGPRTTLMTHQARPATWPQRSCAGRTMVSKLTTSPLESSHTSSCSARDLTQARHARTFAIKSSQSRLTFVSLTYQRVGPWKQPISSINYCRENHRIDLALMAHRRSRITYGSKTSIGRLWSRKAYQLHLFQRRDHLWQIRTSIKYLRAKRPFKKVSSCWDETRSKNFSMATSTISSSNTMLPYKSKERRRSKTEK